MVKSCMFNENKKNYIQESEKDNIIIENSNKSEVEILDHDNEELLDNNKIIETEKTENSSLLSKYKRINKENQKNKSKKRIDIINKLFGKKVHISFETRVVVSVLFILLLFVWACILILQALNFGRNMKIIYSENSDINYNVCVDSVDYYPNTCLNEGMEYLTSITNKIKTKFKYKVDFSTDIDYDLSYHVVATMKIYDNNRKILYENEDLLIKKTKIKDLRRKIDLNKNIEINFKEYNDFVLGYKNNYAVNSSATLEISMYLDEEKETRKVASTLFSLGNSTFGITKNTISNKDKVVEINNNTWNQYNIIFALIGSLLILVALLILFRLTKLVLKVTTKRNEYQTKLAYILREYDRLIVIARNGFVTTREKSITKVENFDELMDARNTLNKPIIYCKINDIKSEFIVEDDERIYKYVMKESDFTN